MRLKDLLITLVILQVGIFLYGVPNLLKYLVNHVFNSFDLSQIFMNFNQYLWIGFNILGIAAVIRYFTNSQNIYGRLLKIYLINHVFVLLINIPTRIMWITNTEFGADLPWTFHFFWLIGFFTLIVTALVYKKQKINILPKPISSKSVRFGHYILDNVYISIIASSTIMDLYNFFNSGLDALNSLNIFAPIFAMVIPFVYYFATEAIFKQSIGKVLTGSYVRSQNGKPANTAQILGRSLCRFIPFEAFSFLTDPMAKWHDKFSGTEVFYSSSIDMRKEEDIIMDHLIDAER